MLEEAIEVMQRDVNVVAGKLGFDGLNVGGGTTNNGEMTPTTRRLSDKLSNLSVTGGVSSTGSPRKGAGEIGPPNKELQLLDDELTGVASGLELLLGSVKRLDEICSADNAEGGGGGIGGLCGCLGGFLAGPSGSGSGGTPRGTSRASSITKKVKNKGEYGKIETFNEFDDDEEGTFN